MKTPVLFLVFNRPDCTSRVFESIRKARPERLYVAGDGARGAREGEAERCAEVRRIATDVDWPCEVRTLFRDENLGCMQAVAGGIDWFFAQENDGIILEDDVVPGEGFFRFMEQSLEMFQNDEKIGLISGFNPVPGFSKGTKPFTARYPYIWGWATWRRVWQGYSLDVRQSSDDVAELVAGRIGHRRAARILGTISEGVRNGTINTWDLQLCLLLLERNLRTIYPPNSLIRNVGFGDDATHTMRIDPRAYVSPIPGEILEFKREDVRNLDAFDIARFNSEYPSFVMRVINRLKRLSST